MAFRRMQNFDAPVPGMAMTHELGARPWQQPAQYTTLEEAVSFYIPRLSAKNFVGRMLDIIEMGVPLTALAETITLGGVMEGVHSIDVAVMVNPILVEYMEGIAKQADIKYTLGDTDDYENEPDGFLLADVMRNLEKSELNGELDKEEEETEEPVAKEEPRGLMARRGV